jgi:hypothetical protein
VEDGNRAAENREEKIEEKIEKKGSTETQRRA